MITPGELNAYDVLCNEYIVFTKATLPAPRVRPPTSTKDAERMKDPRDIILEPVVSEKSYALIDQNIYTFLVHPSASKPEIHDAIEAIFGVKVLQGEHAEPQGQEGPAARKVEQGRHSKPDTKRAIVTLAAGERIELFES